MLLIASLPGIAIHNRSYRKLRFLASMMTILAFVAHLISGPLAAAEVETIPIAYLSQIVERPPNLSNLDIPPEDDGVAGGLLAIEDNNTTGRFMGQKFVFKHVDVPPDSNAVTAFDEIVAEGYRFIVLDVPAKTLLQMADKAADRDVLLLNVGSMDDRLRSEDCRTNVLHIAPSRAMLADALAQFMAFKRWRSWFLVVGQRDEDVLFGQALHRAAKRFGGKIVEERRWDLGPDARRTAQAEVPTFTQEVDYDILMVADEIGEFGEYLAYRTWEPRPVAGTQGLVPTSWHRTHEQWGAVQLQNRFLEANSRYMTPLDYHVWSAIRTIGESATRTRSTDFASVRNYIRSPDFELGAFKGQKLTFRTWNGQLRQPILLATARAMVSVSPQQGFLHERSLLDTMGLDEPESECRMD